MKFYRHTISTAPITEQFKKEVEDVAVINPFVEHVNSYTHAPDFVRNAVVHGHIELNTKWLEYINAQTKHLDVHSVYIHLSEEDWIRLGYPQRLYGQGRFIGGKIIAIGRWHEESDYLRAHKHTKPVRSLKEMTIGIAHEEAHVLPSLLKSGRDYTHYHFYGYAERVTRETEHLASDRWERTPTPIEAFREMDFSRLPLITHKPVVTPVKPTPKSFGIVRHLEHSWDGNNPRALILHTLQGTIEGSYSWLDHITLSYHYLIGEDGKVYEQTPLGRSAWHAGVVHNPTPKARAFFLDNPNKDSIGIAFARNGERELTKAQRASAVQLIKWIGSQTKVHYSADNIFAHVEVTSYKPPEVRGYRLQVLETLAGERSPEEIRAEIREKQGLLVEALILLRDKLLGRLFKKA